MKTKFRKQKQKNKNTRKNRKSKKKVEPKQQVIGSGVGSFASWAIGKPAYKANTTAIPASLVVSRTESAKNQCAELNRQIPGLCNTNDVSRQRSNSITSTSSTSSFRQPISNFKEPNTMIPKAFRKLTTDEIVGEANTCNAKDFHDNMRCKNDKILYLCRKTYNKLEEGEKMLECAKISGRKAGISR